MLMKLTALLLLLASWPALATCQAAIDHVEERRCAEQTVAHLSQEIGDVQRLVRERILAWEEDPLCKERALDLFEAAAKQFEIYRKKQCEFEASAAAGGNGAGDMQLDCQARLGAAYLKALKAQAGWFPPPHA